MLRLVIGKDWTANRAEVFRMLSSDITAKMGGRVLIVPELISYDAERRLCAEAGDTASRYAEVLSFTRLVNRVADATGKGTEDCLDNGGRVVAMASAVRQIHHSLKAFASLETRPEFLTSLIDTVDECKRCCVTAKDLMKASQRADGLFAQKLEELSLILDAYDGLCMRGKRDPRDQLTWMLEQLRDSDFGENHVFYLDGFMDFSRQQLEVVYELILTSTQVTVALNCDSLDTRSIAFERASDTASQLYRFAKEHDIEVSVIVTEPRQNAVLPLLDCLFDGDIADINLGNRLQTYHCDSAYQECVNAAEHIIGLVREGARYRDITIVCTDLNKYRNMISHVFRRCKLPVYMSGTEDILTMPAISAVFSALEAALGGFGQKEVLRYLRSILSPLETDICDRLENYVVMWSISGNAWTREWTNHPDGIGMIQDEMSCATLNELNIARKAALEPLINLKRSFDVAVNLSQQVAALHGFFEEICFSDKLNNLAASMDANGDYRSAQILNQLWEILVNALEQMYDILADTQWDNDTFIQLFRLLLSQYDVGTIPPVLDAVSVGTIDDLRCHQTKHLFVLGAVEGSFPSYGMGSGILSDQERSALRQMGIILNGGSLELLQTQFAEIYSAFNGASHSVSVSYSADQPSFVYIRLEKLSCGESEIFSELGAALVDKTEAGAYLARWNAKSGAEQIGITHIYEDICKKRDHALGRMDSDNVRKLYGNKLNLSASQIDRFGECRFSYFLRYGLRAKERKAATIDPAEFGTFVHAVLEKTLQKVMELGGFQKVDLAKTQEIAQEYSQKYAEERFGQINTKRLTYLFNRNCQELDLIVQEVWQELHDSTFTPCDFELGFGNNGKMSAIEFCGKKMDARLQGFVDRVDIWRSELGNFFRVVDYKTGKKDFDYCDIYNGIGLQMLLYLFALEQEGGSVLGENPIPAGVQYFPARVPMMSSDGVLTEEEYESARAKLWKRKGLLLANEDVLQAMEPGEKPQKLSYTIKKDGTISGDIADANQFRLLKRFVNHLVVRMIDDISSGCVEPNPYTRGSAHNACTYCPYSSVCHSDSVEGRRNYKAINSQQFWDDVEKEMSKNG